MKEAYSNLKEKEVNYETKFKNIINLYKMEIKYSWMIQVNLIIHS